MKTLLFSAACLIGLTFSASAQNTAPNCEGLPSTNGLRNALITAVEFNNGGLGNNMWATVVNRVGEVCLVVNSTEGGLNRVWLGSRVISAQKANTGNSFSLPKGSRGTVIALSSANLYAAVQPGGSLFGLQESNPVDPGAAYAGNPGSFGAGARDPMVGQKIGGINVFGGGLALYDSAGVRVGGLGVSGDTSCADHFVAWRVRHRVNLDFVPGGVSPENDDNMIQDIGPDGQSASGFGHPTCLNNRDPAVLPGVRRPS